MDASGRPPSSAPDPRVWDFTFPAETQERPLTHARVFHVAGKGPTLLFIHGGFHGAWCWAPFMRFFAARGVGVAAVDLRGHGGLVQDARFARAGVAEMCADVVEAAGSIDGKVILAGHSLGALVAMAATAFVSARGLILLAPQPPANIGEIRLLPPFPPEVLVAPPGEERARKWLFGGQSGDLGGYIDRLCPESPAFLNDLYERRVGVNAAWNKGPVLCLSGGRDDSPLHAGGQDEKIAAFYGVPTTRIPEASHCLMADHTRDTSAGLVAAWLADNNLC